MLLIKLMNVDKSNTFTILIINCLQMVYLRIKVGFISESDFCFRKKKKNRELVKKKKK